MKSFPLESLTLSQAQHKQFALVEAICKRFPGAEFLAGGDLGLVPGLHRPHTTQRVEAVLADAFYAEEAVLVQGAGTGAIRAALHALMNPGGTLLVHDAALYPTTAVTVAQMRLSLVRVDYNNAHALEAAIIQHRPNAALVQYSRQCPEDRYIPGSVVAQLTEAGIATVTDDNYAVMKVAKIGCELGATLSTFSCFKLFGPEGVGVVIGQAEAIARIRATLYSGGGQIQGPQAMDVLRGLVFAPVMHAVQAGVIERLMLMVNSGKIPQVKRAVVANAQSRVLLVEFHQPIAAQVLKYAAQLGALPYPVGAESKYEIPPLFHHVSGTFRRAMPDAENYIIRINPNRSGEQTVFNILEESCRSAAVNNK